ncbi:MAG: hypothetical protein ACK47R_06865, partial [Planctomycetia bacterium]
PTVESIKLSRGAQVKAYGSPQADGSETWLPIFPPDSEVRYIKGESIGKAPAKIPGTSSTGSSANPATPKTLASGATTIPNCDGTTRWNQAVNAEQTGNITEAIRLYTQIGQDFACSQNTFATQATNRAMWLRECQRVGTKNTLQACPPGQAKLVSRPSGPAPVTVMPNQNPPAAAPVGPIPSPTQAKSASVVNGNPMGVLRKSGRPYDYQTAYHLESPSGRPLIYLIGAPGQNLDLFLNQRIEVSGPTSYRSDMRAYVMTVYQIQPR